MEQLKLVPPFTAASAAEKLRLNENEWNTCDAAIVAQLYTEDVEWSDKTIFLTGRKAVENYLLAKWQAQFDYTITKELWGAKENRNAIRFKEKWRDSAGKWYHSYGNEQLEFETNGLIRKRFGCVNEIESKKNVEDLQVSKI